MTASASQVIGVINDIREWCKATVGFTAKRHEVSEVLLWILIRDEADKNLAQLKQDVDQMTTD